MVSFCGLDYIPFDFIGHSETLEEWGPELLKRMGAVRVSSVRQKVERGRCPSALFLDFLPFYE